MTRLLIALLLTCAPALASAQAIELDTSTRFDIEVHLNIVNPGGAGVFFPNPNSSWFDQTRIPRGDLSVAATFDDSDLCYPEAFMTQPGPCVCQASAALLISMMGMDCGGCASKIRVTIDCPGTAYDETHIVDMGQTPCEFPFTRLFDCPYGVQDAYKLHFGCRACGDGPG